MTICAYECFWGALYAEIKFVQKPGFFVHQWNVRLADIIPTEFCVLIFGVFYSIALPMPKAAILIKWCRMFAPQGRRSEAGDLISQDDVAEAVGACISAAFRLSTTIIHGRVADATRTLGPLAFWATAGITCGFFILCVPCVPRILKDTGVLRKMKRAVGMKTTNSSKRDAGTGPSSNHSRLAGSTIDNSFYKLDNLKSSESTEYLHGGVPNAGITRTTRIAVMQDSRCTNGDDKFMYP
ncbi:hypothetical protein N7474_007313 [Penicillium riverlandense]|uniref:uncharacterized protein n=1 Tax=Penicillium riverlandense TaxID=1903569 RepID=UPI002549B9B7|nr:uncharacterized protein N7474_007313 [Penicillium riverlandense]KAJ5815536.1 hypothetical protein N7474_007313 [Penicillium riverlandense]